MSAAPKSRLLIIDDNKHLLTSLRDSLAFQGYAVDTATSGEAALCRLDKMTPDLIVLDISMPGMGGMGFLRRLRDRRNSAIPILVLTAKALLEDFFDELDISGFMAKPCREDELLRKIREILARSAAAAIPSAAAHRVLLVEDDPVLTREIKHAFAAGPQSITLESAPSCATGIEKAVALKPDLIMANEVLRGMNGSDLARLIRQMPGRHAVPVLLYRKTGQADGLWVFAHRLEGKQKALQPATDSLGLLDAVCRVFNVTR